MRESVTLRPDCSDDESFLFNLYRSVHEQTFSSMDMSVEQKNEILRMQFNAVLKAEATALYPTSAAELPANQA